MPRFAKSEPPTPDDTPILSGDPDLDTSDDLFGEDDSPALDVNVSQLAGAIVTAVNAAQGPRKIEADEYQRTRSAHRGKPALGRKFYQNGILLSRRQLTHEAIRLLHLLRPGSYDNATIHVVPLREGNNRNQPDALDVRYSNKSVDDRMAFKSKFPTFEHMLRAIVKESGIDPLAA